MEEKFDPEQMSMGVEVEREHKPTIEKIKASIKDGQITMTDEEIYSSVASDHLSEFQDYYSRLKNMEDEAKAEKGEKETEPKIVSGWLIKKALPTFNVKENVSEDKFKQLMEQIDALETIMAQFDVLISLQDTEEEKKIYDQQKQNISIERENLLRLVRETSLLFGNFTRTSFVAHVPGHVDSKGNAAPWTIKDHKTGKILSSHGSESDAKKHLQQMHAHNS